MKWCMTRHEKPVNCKTCEAWQSWCPYKASKSPTINHTQTQKSPLTRGWIIRACDMGPYFCWNCCIFGTCVKCCALVTTCEPVNCATFMDLYPHGQCHCIHWLFVEGLPIPRNVTIVQLCTPSACPYQKIVEMLRWESLLLVRGYSTTFTIRLMAASLCAVAYNRMQLAIRST